MSNLSLIIGEQFEHSAGPNCNICADVERAAAAVEVMGYRKPRSITTTEELDALPFESVVRDAEGHVLERWGGPDESVWVTVMVSNFINRHDIALPATVLYEGTQS